MSDEERKDHFFDFLLDQIEDKEAKKVLKLVKEYSSSSDTRMLIRECLKKINNNHNNV